MACTLLDRPPMTSPCCARRSTRRAGFTLVELGVVVAIIGILAVLAVVGYRKYILNAKMTEAKNVISAIKIAQEDHRAETGAYANLGTDWCPAAAGQSDKKVGWNPECSGNGGNSGKWKNLPVHVSGAVQFKYATVADLGTTAATPPGWVTGTAPTGSPWYTVLATCDLDGIASNDTELFASSFMNEIFSHNDGQ